MSLINETSAWDAEDDFQLLRVRSDSASFASASLTLQFWAAKGLTLTQIEDTYNIDFVVDDNCVPIISGGKFVIIQR